MKSNVASTLLSRTLFDIQNAVKAFSCEFYKDSLKFFSILGYFSQQFLAQLLARSCNLR